MGGKMHSGTHRIPRPIATIAWVAATGFAASMMLAGCAGPPATALAADKMPSATHVPSSKPWREVGHVFETRAEAKRIIYVVDAAGGMITKFPLLRSALVKAVLQLRASQSFNIICFHDGPGHLALDSERMIPSTPEGKRTAYAFLDHVRPAGTTDPMPALRTALAQDPDVIYFMMDAEFVGLPPLGGRETDEIAQLNAGRKVTIHTILLSDADGSTRDALVDIARQSGGTFRTLNEEDLPQ